VIRSLERDQDCRDGEQGAAELRSRFDSLTSRELEVIALVLDGLMNKQIAAKLGVTEITVKVHRGHMMQKMKARSVIELVAMAHRLGIRHQKHEIQYSVRPR
jgi:FixJ family two-component response regulator